MFDRIPQNPNRVKIKPENGGAAYYATMERADNPVQEGTPLNKGTLLTDKTAALFGLGSDAVPDEAFSSLYEIAVPKVGDLKVTLRKDIGDKWLLCNGAIIDHHEYSALKPMLPVSFERSYFANTNSTTQHFGTSDICEHDGVYVACAYYNSYHTFIYVTTDPYGEWTEVELNTSRFGGDKITYQNGMWIITGYYYYSSAYSSVSGYAYCSGDPSVRDNWTIKSLGQIKNHPQGICYYNGTWAMPCTGDTVGIYVTTDLELSWTKIGYVTGARGIDCFNGLWVIWGTNSSYKPCVWTTTDPFTSGSWKETVLDASAVAVINNIKRINGVYYALGGSTYNGSVGQFIYSATDILGTWESVYKGSNEAYNNLFYTNGDWVINANNKVLITENLSEAPEQIFYHNNSPVHACVCVGEHEGDIIAATTSNLLIGSSNYQRVDIYAESYALPTISHDGAYTYVKAKE